VTAIHKNLFLRLRQALLGSFLLKRSDNPRLFSGPGSTLQLAEAISRLDYRTLFVVTDKWLYDLGVLDPTLEALHKAGIQTPVYKRSLPRTTEQEVDQGIERYHAQHCDAVLAFGSDSSICAAKVIALGAANACKAADCIGENICKLPAVPLFTVPVTADTDPSASCTAPLFQLEALESVSVTDASLIAKITVLDPEAMRDLPPHGVMGKPDVHAVLRHSDFLTRNGEWDEAILLLNESNQREEDLRIEAQLVNLRHRAFAAVTKHSTPIEPWPVPIRDLPRGLHHSRDSGVGTFRRTRPVSDSTPRIDSGARYDQSANRRKHPAGD
jgi:hypothetical protein